MQKNSAFWFNQIRVLFDFFFHNKVLFSLFINQAWMIEDLFFQIIVSLHSICERLVAERGHMIFTFKFHLILYYYYIIYIQFQQINDFFCPKSNGLSSVLLFVYICIAIKYPIIKKGRVVILSTCVCWNWSSNALIHVWGKWWLFILFILVDIFSYYWAHLKKTALAVN